MQKKIRFLILVLIGISGNIFADYPIVNHRFLADPGSLVYNDRIYLYCSNDDENTGEGYEMSSIVCVSSSDLKNWTDHGIVLQVPQGASWAGNTWAPTVIERDGTFFLYFGNGGNGIGVATADNPLGPFTDPLDDMLININTPGVLPATDMWLFDPMAFIDDDGQAYLYFGGNGDDNVRVVELNDDMISLKDSVKQLTALNFFEASWMHKYNGKYYFSYSTTPAAGMRIDYMISDSPTSGFTYGGIISEQPPNNNNNNHQAIFNFRGQWYQAYHNRIVASEAGVPATYHRNLCIDQFSHNPDGTINTMVNTVDGLSQLEFINPFERVEAETMDDQHGIYTEVCSAGGMNLSNIHTGDWVKIRGVDFDTLGAGIFEASIASNTHPGISAGGTIEIRANELEGELLGSMAVDYTGGTDTWKTETIITDTLTGVHDLFLVFKGEANIDLFGVDYWKFIAKDEAHDLLAINATVDEYKIDTISGINTTNIQVTAIYTDGTTEDVTTMAGYSFDQDNLATVANGLITGIDYGEPILTVNYNGKTDEVNLIVKNLESELSVSHLVIEDDSLEIYVGSSYTLELMAEFYDGHLENISEKATYDNPSTDIISIENGVITAVGEGEVTFTASYKGAMGETKSTDINVKVIVRDPYIKNEAEDYTEQSGTETESCSDEGGGLDVGYIENGDWLMFTGLDFGEGATTFDVRVASATSGGSVELRLDSRNGPLVGECTFTGTSGWQTWQTKSCTVDGASGVHTLYLVFTGGDGFLFNMNWWQFGNEPRSIQTQNLAPDPYVIAGSSGNFLKGVLPEDVISIYSSSGQLLQSFRSESDIANLNSLEGYVIIVVQRGENSKAIKYFL